MQGRYNVRLSTWLGLGSGLGLGFGPNLNLPCISPISPLNLHLRLGVAQLVTGEVQGRYRGGTGEVQRRYRGGTGEVQGRYRGGTGEIQGRVRLDAGHQLVLRLLTEEALVSVRASVRVRVRVRVRNRVRVCISLHLEWPAAAPS